MPLYFLGFSIAFILTFLTIPLIIQIAKKKSLLDKPDNRKVHQNDTPTLGGAAIFFGFFLSLLLTINLVQLAELKFIIFAASFMLMTGIIDDIISISFERKALSQFFSALLLVVWGNVHITNLYGLFGIYEIDGVFSIVLSILVILTIINAINFIDGIDGNAAFLTIIACLVFGIWFHLSGHLTYALISVAMIGSLLAFLKYNISPAQIFMGDTGSLFVGLMVSVLFIKFLQLNVYTGGEFHINGAPGVALGILIIPLADLITVFLERIFSRRSPFKADNRHIHHKLLHLGFSHNKVVFSLVFTTLFFVVLSLLLRNIDTNILVLIQFGIVLSYSIILHFLLRKKRLAL